MFIASRDENCYQRKLDRIEGFSHQKATVNINLYVSRSKISKYIKKNVNNIKRRIYSSANIIGDFKFFF
jgi:hypothetical protein